MELPLAEILKMETRLPLSLVEIDERLLKDISEHGIREPIEIRVRKDGSKIVWDGLHRLAIAVKLNLATVPVIFVGMPGQLSTARVGQLEESKQRLSEKGGVRAMTDEEIEKIANKVASKVLEEVAPAILSVEGEGLLMHFTEHAFTGHALVVDETRAKATPCRCFTYKERDYCFTPGAIGMLTPEQQAEYCAAGKTHDVGPGAKQRFEKFAEAAEEAHKEIESVPKGERLEPWLRAMGRELSERGVKV